MTWTKPPAAAHELALLMEDPDAPSGTFVHWTVYGLPPTTVSIDEGTPAWQIWNWPAHVRWSRLFSTIH